MMVNMLSGRIRYKRPCNAGFHEYDVSRRGKSTETEGGWWWQARGRGGSERLPRGTRFLLWVVRSALKLESGDGCTTW